MPREGEWVKISENNATDYDLADTGEFGILVYVATRRVDVTGSVGITVIHGVKYVCETANYDTTRTYRQGEELFIERSGDTNFLTNQEPFATAHAVGIFEGLYTYDNNIYLRFSSL